MLCHRGRTILLSQSMNVTKEKKKKIEEMFQIKGAKETRKNAIPKPRLDPELEGDILGSTD